MHLYHESLVQNRISLWIVCLWSAKQPKNWSHNSLYYYNIYRFALSHIVGVWYNNDQFLGNWHSIGVQLFLLANPFLLVSHCLSQLKLIFIINTWNSAP